MTKDILLDIRRFGDLTTTSHLAELGHDNRSVARAVKNGDLRRVARGWVATPLASQLPIIAIANGGILAGATALGSAGVWDAVDRRLHLQLRPNSHGPAPKMLTPISTFAMPTHLPRGVVRHWSPSRYRGVGEPRWRASIVDSLLLVAKTAPREQFIACVDSAIQVRAIPRAALPQLFGMLPAAFATVAIEIDGESGSGLESLARCRLIPLVRLLQTQVAIPGIARSGGEGRVDILIDGWLVIELDGDEFHDPAADRERNAILVRKGYRTHRFGYDQVINRWHEVEATIMELLRYPPHRPR
jgi:hypothetical protein